jgi:Helix-turn-helix domain
MKTLPLHERLRVPVGTAAQAAGVSEVTVWRAISDGELEVAKVRGRTLISVSSLFRWLKLDMPPPPVPADIVSDRRRAPDLQPAA